AGADPQRISLGVDGADRMELDAQGDLVVHTGGGLARLHQPHVYQMANGGRQDIKSRYVLTDRHQVGGWVAAYDARKPLGIDPTLVYASFLGGSADENDQGAAIAVDAAGHAYVTGRTSSLDFPTTPGVFQSGVGGSADAFVTKLDPAGAALVYSTYLGGNSV